MPAGVPAATTTALPLRLMPALVVLTWVRITSEAFTAAPFKRSLVSTLLTAVPPVYPLAEPLSATASIKAADTVTLTSA